MSTVSVPTNLWIVGLILAVVGIIIVAIPFAALTHGYVDEQMTDTLGWIIFIIGIIFIVIWAIFYAIRHH